MSQTKSRVLETWKPIEARLQSTEMRSEFGIFSPDDRARIANCYVLWCLLIQDLFQSRYTSDANLQHWILEVASNDVSLCIEDLKNILANLRLVSPYMGPTTEDWTSFKHWLTQECNFGTLLVRPILVEIKEFWRNPSGRLFRKLNTFCSFPTRLTCRDMDELEKEALEDYIEFDETFPEEYLPNDIRLLRSELKPICSNYSRTSWPYHSAGATAEWPRNSGAALKEAIVNEDYRTQQFLHRRGYPLGIRGSYYPLYSKLQFVPKGIVEKRPVCMEPTTRMWMQHAVDEDLRLAIRNTAGYYVDFTDQSHNCRLAEEGSRDLTYATIDLSSASDSVSLSLVEQVFSGALKWDLLTARTSTMQLPDGRTLKLKKFAPMGSATTFSVESCIFAAVVRAVAREKMGRIPYYRVYGDDIVVPSSIFAETVAMLERLHFRVNPQKSYPPDSCFKESCGYEGFDGVDVTPLRIPRGFDIVALRKASPGALSGGIDLVNRFFDWGLLTPRLYLMSELPLGKIRFTEDLSDSSAIHTIDASNYRLRHRRNRDLQRVEVRCQVPAARIIDTPDDMRYHLLMQAYARTRRKCLLSPDDRIDCNPGPVSLSAKFSWLTG